MKAKTPSTALAIPTFVPPARKEDVITAMVERARVKHQEEREKYALNKEALNKAVEGAIIALFNESPHLFVQSVDFWNNSAEIKFDCQKLPAKIVAVVAAARNAPTICSFDPVATKRAIRDGMYAGGDRVKALLDNPETVKALDAALESITKK